MKIRPVSFVVCVTALIFITGCQHNPTRMSGGKSFVIIGESMATGAEAAQELQLAINRSQTVGCEAISVGGYGAAGEGMVLGLAALIRCPDGVHIIPTGFPYDATTGMKIPVDPAAVVPPPLSPPAP
ncbi:hypothetical protein [Amphritea pacifica]|uniref:Tail specific protease domain-containing protein n=1 Tax=Amphritea pacifica TaxID=2811233 RepID=A0ABS2W5X0_9GAMM|nr:hypothetical protein [Amphritea pacifica]MBN0987110.1 hypothetical protein [Amphritea pacifica]MBN1007884.1 hypothetical protein [Amphritea pacifica]